MADAAIQRYLEHLRVERRVSAHTLTAYGEALARLEKLAADAQRPLRALQGAHIQRFAAQLHGGGLGARSIALTLSGWRGFYRWWSLQSDAAGLKNNPVDGVRAPRAPRPLPKALAVDEAVALATQETPVADDVASPEAEALAARDHAIAELLYGCGLRLGELL
ncbi:MAG TPA: site-specific integrase, partial [Burkholderiaceae bacterium]|nr:site-specific integrase [Burkholderiaceae bacterium]